MAMLPSQFCDWRPSGAAGWSLQTCIARCPDKASAAGQVVRCSFKNRDPEAGGAGPVAGILAHLAMAGG